MLRGIVVAAVLLSGCATSYRGATAAPVLSPFTFTLTPEQCATLRAELRKYRAVEQTSIYVAGAGALVSVAAAAIPAFRDEHVVQGLAAGTTLLAGSGAAFTNSQVNDLEEEIALGGCK